MTLVLHGYWRSSAAYRVRIALHLKGLDFSQVTHDLRKGEQAADAFRLMQPQALVPALETPSGVLTQSLAIMEWLEETYPDPPLLPQAPRDRAVVRAMAELVACDIHPLNNLRVLKSLRRDFAASDAQIQAWIARWVEPGFAALERQITLHGGDFCFGDAPGLAECCLLPQVYGATRYEVDMAPYPRIRAVCERAGALPAFEAARPELQPDADPS